MSDRRIYPVTVYDTAGNRKVVGTALTTTSNKVFEVRIDDPEIAKMIVGNLKDDMFSITPKEK